MKQTAKIKYTIKHKTSAYLIIHVIFINCFKIIVSYCTLMIPAFLSSRAKGVTKNRLHNDI